MLSVSLFFFFFYIDVPNEKREKLLIKKLFLCSVTFDFTDPKAELHGKQIKHDTLLELHKYISVSSGGVLTENIYKEFIRMVCINYNIILIY